MRPSWSADGKNILYSACDDRKGLTTGLYEANAYGALDGNRKKLLDNVRQGALSPDGKHLACIARTTEPNGDKTDNIVVSNADGSQPKQLTRFRDSGPIGFQWSSDGRHIYFTRPTSPDAAQAINYQIYAMEADGSHMQALTKGDAPDYLGATPDLLLANDWINRIAMMK